MAALVGRQVNLCVEGSELFAVLSPHTAVRAALLRYALECHSVAAVVCRDGAPGAPQLLRPVHSWQRVGRWCAKRRTELAPPGTPTLPSGSARLCDSSGVRQPGADAGALSLVSYVSVEAVVSPPCVELRKVEERYVESSTTLSLTVLASVLVVVLDRCTAGTKCVDNLHAISDAVFDQLWDNEIRPVLTTALSSSAASLSLVRKLRTFAWRLAWNPSVFGSLLHLDEDVLRGALAPSQGSSCTDNISAITDAWSVNGVKGFTRFIDTSAVRLKMLLIAHPELVRPKGFRMPTVVASDASGASGGAAGGAAGGSSAAGGGEGAGGRPKRRCIGGGAA